jgi:hypothetical protein
MCNLSVDAFALEWHSGMQIVHKAGNKMMRGGRWHAGTSTVFTTQRLCG